MNAIYKMDLAKINEMQASSASEVLHKAKNAHTIDIVIRKDGKEVRYEGDWLKHLRLFCFDDSQHPQDAVAKALDRLTGKE